MEEIWPHSSRLTKFQESHQVVADCNESQEESVEWDDLDPTQEWFHGQDTDLGLLEQWKQVMKVTEHIDLMAEDLGQELGPPGNLHDHD